MRYRRRFWPVAIALLLALGYGLPRLWSQPWREVSSVEVDRGYYYRLRANYLYHGQPLRFDIVAGCGVAVTHYSWGGSSQMVGLAPLLYGLRAPDNKAVMVLVPQFCDGRTTYNPDPHQRVSAHMAPFVVVYDNADRPMFGWGYATDDAYASPLSELAFQGATVTSATRAEFLAWRRAEAPRNTITPAMLDWTYAPKGPPTRYPRLGEWRLGSQCRGALRLAAPPAVRAALRGNRPPDAPRYWAAKPSQLPGLEPVVRQTLYDGHDLISRQPAYLKGITRNEPGTSGEDHPGFTHYSSPVYPMRSNFSFNTLSLNPAQPPELIDGDVILDPARRGFVFCDNQMPPHRDYTSTSVDPWYFAPRVPRRLTVNGERVLTHEQSGASPQYADWYDGDQQVFERVEMNLDEMETWL